MDLMEKHGIYSAAEMKAREEIHLEEYSKTINIEALTMLSMVKRQITPAVLNYIKDLTAVLSQKKALGDLIDSTGEETQLSTISKLYSSMIKKIDTLDRVVVEAQDVDDALAQAKFYLEKVIAAMESLRATADELETMVGEKYWPYPIYEDLLFYV